MVQQVFQVHELLVDMVSDRVSQFMSWFWKAFCTLIGSSASLSSGFHPQSNIQSERANQDLEMASRCLVSANPTTWSQLLVWEENARNTLSCSVTVFSPFECVAWDVSPRSSLSKKKKSANPLPRCSVASVAVPGREPWAAL
jgi:hypothetical protein